MRRRSASEAARTSSRSASSRRRRSTPVWERVRRFVDDEVLPVVNADWERAEFPRPLAERLRLDAADERVLVRR